MWLLVISTPRAENVLSMQISQMVLQGFVIKLTEHTVALLRFLRTAWTMSSSQHEVTSGSSLTDE